MAVTLYRVQLTQQTLSYNAGEIGYFDATTAARLVAVGRGTALDVLPASIPAPPANVPLGDFIDDGGLPIPGSSTDSANLQAEAGVLPSN